MTTHLILRFTLFLFAFLAVSGCEKNDSTAVVASETPVADRDWPLHGRVNGEDRFSPLAQINTENVADVGLAWEVSMDSQRGLEATPIVVDGVMYVTSTWSRVFAVDAKTGESLWEYDPEVPRDWAARGCCDVVNRGVAVADGRLSKTTAAFYGR